MTGKELESFYLQDKKDYILEENQEFLSVYNEYKKKNNDFDLKCMTKLMKKIKMFYEFKIPNVLFGNSIKRDTIEYKNMLEISRLMDMKQFILRLHHDEKEFLQCDYSNYDYVRLEKHLNYSTFPYLGKQTHYINLNNGFSNPADVALLNENVPSRQLSIEELYTCLSTASDIDISELKGLLDFHKYNLILRKKLVELTALQILFSENTLPIYGFYRANEMIKDFNQTYQLNINPSFLEDIINIACENGISLENSRVLFQDKNNED